jgi:hypothetical protein
MHFCSMWWLSAMGEYECGGVRLTRVQKEAEDEPIPDSPVSCLDRDL